MASERLETTSLEEVATPVRSKPKVKASVAGWQLAGHVASLKGWVVQAAPLGIILALGAVLRLIGIGRIGYNADEAVYASQGASIAGVQGFTALFPVFRAHPLLFQALLSIIYSQGVSDAGGRMLAAGFGVATIWVTYLIGRRVYGRRTGLMAAAILAAMPYHVVVTRQVLLDGPMVFFATATLYLAVRYVQDRDRPRWLFATMAMMGLTFLTKETSVLLLGGLVVYFLISPRVDLERGEVWANLKTLLGGIRRRQKDRMLGAARALLASLRQRYWRTPALCTAAAAGLFVVLMAILPLSVAMSGHKSTGQGYLAWQLFRRANHTYAFYAQVVPSAVGWAVVALVALAVLRLIRQTMRRQQWDPAVKLALCWATVPIAAFEVYPVKGFQYLLPVAPVAAVLAAHQITSLPRLLRIAVGGRGPSATAVQAIVACGVIISLAWPSWAHINPTAKATFMAGSGGVPQGREAGQYIKANLPQGAAILTVGPSMANIIEWYSLHPASALSVSPNPLDRNPSYTAVDNPDRELREGRFPYLVWDAYSANRSPHFADKLMVLMRKYEGVPIKTFYIQVRSSRVPVIQIYEVRR
jgi:4-amino-4-deoxy-L-arabinose transferase-like glycosyltransferase